MQGRACSGWFALRALPASFANPQILRYVLRLTSISVISVVVGMPAVLCDPLLEAHRGGGELSHTAKCDLMQMGSNS